MSKRKIAGILVGVIILIVTVFAMFLYFSPILVAQRKVDDRLQGSQPIQINEILKEVGERGHSLIAEDDFSKDYIQFYIDAQGFIKSIEKGDVQDFNGAFYYAQALLSRMQNLRTQLDYNSSQNYFLKAIFRREIVGFSSKVSSLLNGPLRDAQVKIQQEQAAFQNAQKENTERIFQEALGKKMVEQTKKKKE